MAHHDLGSLPADLRARVFRLGDDEVLVFSFRLDGGRAALLTGAEQAVAERVATGASNSEIAAERGRSINTVAKQVAAVFRKLGVCSRQELACALARVPLSDEP